MSAYNTLPWNLATICKEVHPILKKEAMEDKKACGEIDHPVEKLAASAASRHQSPRHESEAFLGLRTQPSCSNMSMSSQYYVE